jgi:uncharacterized protein YcbX
MWVAEIWRYPVKSMAGERLEAVEIRGDGLVGDRVVQARDARGRVLTARTVPALLGLRGTWDPERAAPRVDGRPWDAPEVAAAVERAAGPGVRLVRDDGEARFDILPLLVATDGAARALALDTRRLRPNLVIGGVEGLAERTWPGRRLRVGRVLLEVAQLRTRCVMTTYDPDTLAQDPGVLRRIVRELGGSLALDCAVLVPGPVRVGDPAALEGAAPVEGDQARAVERSATRR